MCLILGHLSDSTDRVWARLVLWGGAGANCAESLNTDVTRDRKPCATAIRRTDLCYLSTLRLAELGDALDMRSVGVSPALRLLHPGCMFSRFAG
jgi:hypothetical protein